MSLSEDGSNLSSDHARYQSSCLVPYTQNLPVKEFMRASQVSWAEKFSSYHKRALPSRQYLNSDVHSSRETPMEVR